MILGQNQACIWTAQFLGCVPPLVQWEKLLVTLEECELDINNETVERTKYGKKPERETESSGIMQRAG